MTIERAKSDRSDEGGRLRLSELADLVDVPEAELTALVDCGVLTPVEGMAGQWVFGLHALTVARTARRLVRVGSARRDFSSPVASSRSCIRRKNRLTSSIFLVAA